MKFHAHFAKRLKEIQERHPGLVEGPYGVGGMMAFSPLGGDPQVVVHFIQKLFQAVVMSFIAGRPPIRCRFLAPLLAIQLEDIDNVMKIVEETLIACLKQT